MTGVEGRMAAGPAEGLVVNSSDWESRASWSGPMQRKGGAGPEAVQRIRLPGWSEKEPHLDVSSGRQQSEIGAAWMGGTPGLTPAA